MEFKIGPRAGGGVAFWTTRAGGGAPKAANTSTADRRLKIIFTMRCNILDVGNIMIVKHRFPLLSSHGWENQYDPCSPRWASLHLSRAEETEAEAKTSLHRSASISTPRDQSSPARWGRKSSLICSEQVFTLGPVLTSLSCRKEQEKRWIKEQPWKKRLLIWSSHHSYQLFFLCSQLVSFTLLCLKLYIFISFYYSFYTILLAGLVGVFFYSYSRFELFFF